MSRASEPAQAVGLPALSHVAASIRSDVSATPSQLAIASFALTAGILTIGWRFLTFSGFNNDHYVHMRWQWSA